MKVIRIRNIRKKYVRRLRRRPRITEMSSVSLSLIHKIVPAATIYSTWFKQNRLTLWIEMAAVYRA
jgi:hypothetical protein